MDGELRHLDEFDRQLATLTNPLDLDDLRARIQVYEKYVEVCNLGLATQNLVALKKFQVERRLGALLPPPAPRGRPARNGRVNSTPPAEFPERILNSREQTRLRKVAAIPEGELLAQYHTCTEAGVEFTRAEIKRIYDRLFPPPEKNGEAPARLFEEPEKTPAEELLADLTNLTRRLTLFINSPDGAKLKDYLHACKLGGWLHNRTIRVRLDDGSYKDLPVRWRGFNALRWFIRLAGKKGVKPAQTVWEEFREAKKNPAEGEWPGDEEGGE